jgi:hypothetical protein
MLPEVKRENGKRRFFITRSQMVTSVSILFLCLALPCCTGPAMNQPGSTKKATENIDPAMGDWQGSCKTNDGAKSPLVAQVIALGKGEYRANLLAEFDKRIPPIAVLNGRRVGAKVRFSGRAKQGTYGGTEWWAVIEGDKFTGKFRGRKTGSFVMEKIVRLSPTLGAKPPAGALVLFDGKDFDQWEHLKKPAGLINLASIIGGNDCAAYLRTNVWSAKEQEAILELGSDDGVKVWLNGQLVHANNVMRGIGPGQDKVKVTLKQGWNTLMLKVTQGGGDWAACVRLVGTDGKKLHNIGERYKGKDTREYLDKNDGYLTVWSVSGPYRQEGKDGGEIFDVAFAPERPDAKGVKWEAVERSPFQKKSVQWKIVNDAMEIKPGSGSIVTKKKSTDFKLHLEFRTPFMPEARGQDRGNSGVYLQGRYEVQILDSYGLEGRDNECGGIYKVGGPRVNMCAAPMQWQTYDITFHAPRFDNNGRKKEEACVTVYHNGVKIHDKVEIPKPTGGALDNNVTQPGGIYLQDHGNPVQFRNIWLVELS